MEEGGREGLAWWQRKHEVRGRLDLYVECTERSADQQQQQLEGRGVVQWLHEMAM